MGKHLSNFELGQIITYREIQPPLSYQQIANLLKKDKSTIKRSYTRIKNTKNSKRKAGSGRPLIINNRQRHHIKFLLIRNPFLTVKEIK